MVDLFQLILSVAALTCFFALTRARAPPGRAAATTAVGAQACSLSVDVVQRQRHAAIFFFAKWRPAPAAMGLGDGPRAARPRGRARRGAPPGPSATPRRCPPPP